MRRIAIRPGLLLLVAVLGEPGVIAGQQRQVPGTFRSTTLVVPVDVRVLDRNGRPVTDLNQQDFTILEDGVRQEIRQFSSIALAPEPVDPGTKPAFRRVATGSSQEWSPQRQRTFLILLGRGRLQPPSRGVDAMIRFVRERLLPQDQVAVLAYNRASDFTTDHERTARLLEQFARGHEAIEARLDHNFGGLPGLYGTKTIPPRIQATIDEMFRVADGPGLRTVPPGRVTDSGRIAEDYRRIGQRILDTDVANNRGEPVVDPFDRSAVAGASLEAFISGTTETMADLENLYTGIEYLRYLEGEKHLIYVSERGLFLPTADDDRNIAAMANDARVVLDAIQTGGISPGPDPDVLKMGGAPVPGPTFTERFAIATLRTMAELTGGQMSAFAYADDTAAKIDQATRFEYLLGYTPATTASNGRYRKIAVKVNRSDVTLYFRHGYYDQPQLAPFDRRTFLTYSRVTAAALYPQDIRDIKLRLKASFDRNPEGGGEVVAEVKIDLARILLEEKNGRREAKLDVAFIVANKDGKGIGELWNVFDVSLTEDAYRRALKDDLTYVKRIPATTYPWMVKVVVYDYAGDVVGSTETRIY
jgi:VWFA-related protein